MRFPFAPIVLAGLLAACSSGSDLFVTLPAHVPTPGSSALAQTPPGSISIALFDEQRPSGKTSGWIGERAGLTASRPANAVYAVPPPGIAVRDALISEFRAAGWQVQRDAATHRVKRDLGFGGPQPCGDPAPCRHPLFLGRHWQTDAHPPRGGVEGRAHRTPISLNARRRVRLV